MAEYEQIDQVTGAPVFPKLKLRLQMRLELPPAPFSTISWRDCYSTGSNRRFYYAEGRHWTIPAQLALGMLVEAEAKGMLAPEYDDPFKRFGGEQPTIESSSDLPPDRREQLWQEITCSYGEPDWGRSPAFVIGTEARGHWRKIRIVDDKRETVTFRSTTLDADYGMARRMDNGTAWLLDGSMQDACVQTTRACLQALRELVSD